MDSNKEAEKSFDQENEMVGKNIIRACIKNLRRGLGGADFQADVDFLQLTPGVPK